MRFCFYIAHRMQIYLRRRRNASRFMWAPRAICGRETREFMTFSRTVMRTNDTLTRRVACVCGGNWLMRDERAGCQWPRNVYDKRKQGQQASKWEVPGNL